MTPKMRPSTEGKRRTQSSPTRNPAMGSSRSEPGPSRSRRPSRLSPPSASSFLEPVLVTEDLAAAFEDLVISADNADSIPNPRSFPYSVKLQCWDKAEKVKGRDSDRWRRDPLGNTVFRKLVGCSGCLCHDYDHIVPYSKGGKSTVENCQVLQARVNRSKGNRTDISKADLIQRSSFCRVSGRDMDLLELSAYGNIHHAQDSGGCRIQ